MANIIDRTKANAPGAYYVDNSCIDCDMCRTTAPRIYRRDEEIGGSIVFHQPRTPEELAEAEEGRVSCPTDSIGNDGVAVPGPVVLDN